MMLRRVVTISGLIRSSIRGRSRVVTAVTASIPRSELGKMILGRERGKEGGGREDGGRDVGGRVEGGSDGGRDGEMEGGGREDGRGGREDGGGRERVRREGGWRREGESEEGGRWRRGRGKEGRRREMADIWLRVRVAAKAAAITLLMLRRLGNGADWSLTMV